MTTETPRPTRKNVTQQITEYRADELLARIHEWSIRPEPSGPEQS